MRILLSMVVGIVCMRKHGILEMLVAAIIVYWLLGLF